jgi:hypothetical protein
MVFAMDSTQPTEFELDDDLQNAPEAVKLPLSVELTREEAQLHHGIKARTTIPDTFKKLPRSDPPRPFKVHLLPDFIERFGL